jgi:serine/threonine protein kinase
MMTMMEAQLPPPAEAGAKSKGAKVTPTLLEGQTLGKYRVMEPLGRGGMARVYRAYHPQLDRYVAIKVLRADLVEEEEFLARFRREARAVAALRHPNIVQVFDFDVQDDVYYMVMELMEGDTLKARLGDYAARGEPMPLGEMTRILLDVLDGLAYAHSEGMIHRDIKPANIMLTRRGQAVLTDFGIAQIVGGTRYTVSGALMGTLNYMAPEQGLEGHSDARSDIYSLGIVLYEIFTGRTPFDADTPLAILMKHVNDPLTLPHQLNAATPEPYERIILKALAKHPEDRYQSAQEMAQALRDAAQATRVTLPERISLPLSFSTAEAPSEPVAVFSGTAREKIADAQRIAAADDTDTTLSKRLAAPSGAQDKPQAQPAAMPEPVAPPQVSGLGKTVLSTLGFIALVISAVVLLAGFTGRWEIIERGWPIVVILVGFLLSAIMVSTALMAMVIPISIVSGTGMILSYFSITGRWDRWFIWLLEPALVFVPLVFFIFLGDTAKRFPWLGRLLGLILGIANLVAVAGILDTVAVHMAG